jgi:hypothetical protein
MHQCSIEVSMKTTLSKAGAVRRHIAPGGVGSGIGLLRGAV